VAEGVLVRAVSRGGTHRICSSLAGNVWPLRTHSTFGGVPSRILKWGACSATRRSTASIADRFFSRCALRCSPLLWSDDARRSRGCSGAQWSEWVVQHVFFPCSPHLGAHRRGRARRPDRLPRVIGERGQSDVRRGAAFSPPPRPSSGRTALPAAHTVSPVWFLFRSRHVARRLLCPGRCPGRRCCGTRAPRPGPRRPRRRGRAQRLQGCWPYRGAEEADGGGDEEPRGSTPPGLSPRAWGALYRALSAPVRTHVPRVPGFFRFIVAVHRSRSWKWALYPSLDPARRPVPPVVIENSPGDIHPLPPLPRTSQSRAYLFPGAFPSGRPVRRTSGGHVPESAEDCPREGRGAPTRDGGRGRGSGREGEGAGRRTKPPPAASPPARRWPRACRRWRRRWRTRTCRRRWPST